MGGEESCWYLISGVVQLVTEMGLVDKRHPDARIHCLHGGGQLFQLGGDYHPRQGQPNRCCALAVGILGSFVLYLLS